MITKDVNEIQKGKKLKNISSTETPIDAYIKSGYIP